LRFGEAAQGTTATSGYSASVDWFVASDRTAEQNDYWVCQEVCSQFEKDGFQVCVLKGQANHRYYPIEMGNRRNCGDVDIWVSPISDVRRKKDDVKRTLGYVDAHYERDGLCWLHCNL
jgi:hypothetical protein